MMQTEMGQQLLIVALMVTDLSSKFKKQPSQIPLLI